jgi:dCMP deaminase
MKPRIDKINYYLDIAQTVSERCTCLRRHFGAIIVRNDSIVSTGYVGAPRGRVNCTDRKICLREEQGIPKGQRYDLCRSVHAEANAIIAAARDQMLGATLYETCVDPQNGAIVPGTSPCSMCRRLIINAGIETVIMRETPNEYKVYKVQDWVDNDESLTGKGGYGS